MSILFFPQGEHQDGKRLNGWPFDKNRPSDPCGGSERWASNVSIAPEGGELPNLNSIKSIGMPLVESGSSSDAEIPT